MQERMDRLIGQETKVVHVMALALHRRAEAWMAVADVFQARGQDAEARWSWRRGAAWERKALETFRREHPGSRRTIAILEESARAMEEKAQ